MTGTLPVTEKTIAVFDPAPQRLKRLGEWFGASYGSLLRFAYFLTGNGPAIWRFDPWRLVARCAARLNGTLPHARRPLCRTQ